MSPVLTAEGILDEQGALVEAAEAERAEVEIPLGVSEAHVRPGAGIPDPSRLFNSSLEGNTRRAIDIHEGELDEGADGDVGEAGRRAARLGS